MKIKIGVMGSSEAPKDKLLNQKAIELGKQIALRNCILVNGATSGFPNAAAIGATQAGGFVLGISPANNLKEHKTKYKLPFKYCSTIVYTGLGYNFRNIINIRSSDAVIFVRGSFGTLNEFTIAYEEGKVIGILGHFGGISEFFDEIVEICKKKTGAKIIHEKDPKILVDKLIKAFKK